MTATPTNAERAQAKRLAYLHPGFSPGRVNAIAQALADVRAEVAAEVTAKYEAVAEYLEAWAALANERNNEPAVEYGIELASRDAAARIRQVSR